MSLPVLKSFLMKPLEQLINTEKAALLFQLFPAEIPAFLEYVSNMNDTLKEEQERQRENWQGLITFELWMQLVNQAEQTIAKYGRQLHKSHRLFSEQLFDGNLAIYLIHCLISYVGIRKHDNAKFVLAVNLLFNA